MCVTDVVSLKESCYKVDLFVMVHGVEKQHICDKCCVTKKPGCYLAYYFNLSSGEFASTSFHKGGSWYLPMFLLRYGSFTLMKCLL